MEKSKKWPWALAHSKMSFHVSLERSLKYDATVIGLLRLPAVVSSLCLCLLLIPCQYIDLREKKKKKKKIKNSKF